MYESNVQPLTSMKPRQKAFIVALNAGDDLQNRLASMGLHVGKEVEVLFPCTRFNGPTIVAAGEARLAIGYGMASRIIVAADPL